MNIATHRFRGFDSNENSKKGLIKALQEGVQLFEFDVRLTNDKKPVINHDYKTGDTFVDDIDITLTNYDELISIPYINSLSEYIMTLEELLRIFSARKDNFTKIFIDIKDFGEEEKIYKMLAESRLLSQTVIVSWLPEVLFSFYNINPNIPLCFSHNFVNNKISFQFRKFLLKKYWLKSILANLVKPFNLKKSNLLSQNHHFFEDYNDREKIPGKMISNLPDFEHTLCNKVEGKLRDILVSSKGFICINFKSIPPYFQKEKGPNSVGLIFYSVNTKAEIDELNDKIKPDYILSDNPVLVSKV